MRKLKILAILFIMVGIIIMFFPQLSNYVYENKVKSEKEDFVNTVANNSGNTEQEQLLEQLYEDLKSQNEELYSNKQENLVDPFSYEQPSIDLNKYGITNNTIGYIRIPKLNIELPVLLGANTVNMKKGAVHLTETSYPIGGENTNSVIAAHRGYGKATMFRHIEKLEVGDEICIRNFKEELTYKVYEIKIINPDDIRELEIKSGDDIITLITCHPYRVNNQRYIVKAQRAG